MRKIILASASPRRRELLAGVGATFQICRSNGEENITKEDPDDIVKELSLQKATTVAEERKLDYAVDIYPRYGSDVGAAWSAGNDVKGALIGPGVHASHGMERTHYKGMENTIQLILAYLGC